VPRGPLPMVRVRSRRKAPHATAHCVRPSGHASAAEGIAQSQSAPNLRQWSKTKRSELDILTLEESLARAVERSQHSAPRNIQEAAQAEITYLRTEKLDLLKSKSSSQFNGSSKTIIAKTVGVFESLAQHVNKQCGGTTTYYSQSQSQGTLGQLSPLPASEEQTGSACWRAAELASVRLLTAARACLLEDNRDPGPAFGD
jgi:hypothetical protein